MSKNTQISELINYISVDGSGNVVLSSGQLVATQSYVSTAITNLVNSAPSTLDTLNELATALGNDPNFATTVATSIGTKQAQLNGTGFVKISGTTISYDNSTYLTTGTASSTYQIILTNPVTGTGTINYLPKFTASSAIGNSLIYDTGSIILIGATTASDNQSKLELINNGPVGLKIKSSAGNGNNTFLSIESSKEWRFVTNRGDLISGNQGDLIVRNNTDGINHIILNQNGTSNFYSSITVSGTVNAINTLNLYKTGGTTLGGQLAYDSAINQLYLWNNVSSGYFSIYTNSTERLNIGSDGTSTFKGPGIVVNRPTASSGEPFVAFSKDGVSRGSIYGADGTAGLRFFSDVNTFIVNASSTITLASAGTDASMIKAGAGDELYLGGNNTWQMRLSGGNILMDNGGNLGINTASPLERFSVNGNIHIAGVGNSLLFDTDASGRAISQYVTNLYEFHIVNARGNSSRFVLGNGSISLGTSATPQFYINTSTGNVGIATTSPLKNLHVYASNGSGIGIGRNLTNDNFSANLFFYPSSTSADKRNWAITTYYGAPGLMEFRRSTTTTSDPYDNGVTVMSLDSVTNFVGIGTSSPTEPLSVSFQAHGLISQHRQSNGIGVGQNFYMKFNNAAGSAVSYAGIYSDIQDNTTGAHSGRMILQVASAGSLLSAVTIASSGNVGISEVPNTIARLNISGSTKMNRSFYNWYQSYWTGNGTYWHMKTNMNAGLGGNIQYTMSLFKGYMYSYEGSIREGSIGFHNWDGAFYNVAYNGNLFTNVYRSSDNFVVLVIPSAGGETGVTIDWHQAYAYPFVNAQVTAAGLHGSTTGKY